MKASLCAALAAAAVTAAVAAGCDSGGKDTQASTESSSTTTIRVDGKNADIQTGVLTSKTTYVWEIEIGGGKILRCVRSFNGDGVVTREDCKKVRSR